MVKKRYPPVFSKALKVVFDLFSENNFIWTYNGWQIHTLFKLWLQIMQTWFRCNEQHVNSIM